MVDNNILIVLKSAKIVFSKGGFSGKSVSYDT